MKSRMTISNLSVPLERIKPVGGRFSTTAAGHQFDLTFRVEVKAPVLGRLVANDIECPQLQWNERIEWFRFDTSNQQWAFAGEIARNMYAHNRDSQTFWNWQRSRYMIATDVTNRPPAALAAMKSEEDAKKWIARNGFSWNLHIRDKPRMGILAGTGGGGGLSLVTGDTRAVSSISILASKANASERGSCRSWKRSRGGSRFITSFAATSRKRP